MLGRRGFLLGAIAAPVIVKAAWIMPVKKVLLPEVSPVWGRMVLNGFDELGRPAEVIREILQKDVVIQNNGFYRVPLHLPAEFSPGSFVTVKTQLAVPDHLTVVTGELASPGADTWVVGPLIKHDQ